MAGWMRVGRRGRMEDVGMRRVALEDTLFGALERAVGSGQRE